MKRILVVAAAALCFAFVGSIGQDVAGTPAAHADPTNVLLVQPGVCLALMGGANGPALSSCGQPGSFDYPPNGHNAWLLVEKTIGNNDGVVEPSDLAGADTFSGGQIHQTDGDIGLEQLLVVAFVASNSPVTFHTTAGYFGETTFQSPTWSCQAAPTAQSTNFDPDCGGAPGTGQDHVVVARLVCSLATCPTLGEAHLTIEQDGIVYPKTFTIVGEPRSVTFFTLEKSVQAGVTSDDKGNIPGSSPAAPACPFSASLSFITKALAEAEKTVVVARALDINGTAIVGGWFNFSVDPATNTAGTNVDSQGIISLASAPTLNLGGFGYGAPNILCARVGATAGTITVRARFIRDLQGLTLDRNADPGDTAPNLAFGDITFNMNAVPAKMTLAASPAQVPCDGTSTSTVSAALTDAAGNPAINGTAVHFDVQVLGAANPINTTTDGKGIATTTITPLSGGARGVPVTVSVMVGGIAQPDLTQSILVQCGGAAVPAGSPGGGAAAGGAGAGVSAPSGTISPPNTGMGVSGDNGRRLTWWPAFGLLVAAMAVLAVRYARPPVARSGE